jgi:hypothetical protein
VGKLSVSDAFSDRQVSRLQASGGSLTSPGTTDTTSPTWLDCHCR